MAKAREWSSLRKTTELLATLPSLWQSVLAPWLQRNFPACEACGSLLRFIGVVMRGRHYSNRKPFWSFLWGKGENRAAKRLNICLEWLVLSLPMPPALWKYAYAFKNISYQHHWLKNCWVFCPLGIVIYFKLLLWRWGWTSWESLYGNSWPIIWKLGCQNSSRPTLESLGWAAWMLVE